LKSFLMMRTAKHQERCLFTNGPGLSRVLRRIEEEGGKRIGWVAAIAVNRFTRDLWGVTPGTLMQACFEHNVWIATVSHFYAKPASSLLLCC
jgi:hypothetical protein